MADDESITMNDGNQANVNEEELDAVVDEEVENAEPKKFDTMNIDGANDEKNDLDAEMSGYAARIPAKKDASLREFLGKMDEYAPIVRISAPH